MPCPYRIRSKYESLEMLKKIVICLLVSVLLLKSGSGIRLNAQENNGNAHNPIIWADVPDPSVIRIGDVYYMSSTTMHMNPGVPIMKSSDLINWETVSYAYDILADNNAMNLRNGQEAYGDGSWASSIRFHDGTFYVVTFSYTTNRTHIYQTDNIENGPWSSYTLTTVCHDPSLLFDNDRVFVVYGIDDIRILELNSDVTAIKQGGLNQVIIPKASQIAGSNFYVSAEGSHIYKIDGRYYEFLISWPAGGMRTELVYRADNLTGPYEGKIALRDDGIAQGGIIDSPEGNWYALLFQDHGSVGRIPYLIPLTWEDGWPVIGENGQVPDQLNIPVTNDAIPKIVASDEFDWDSGLPWVWQWNHNPDNSGWSVTERPGFFRLTNGRIDTGFLDTQNTLTQRTFGPECSGKVAMDVSRMKDGDIAGLGVLQKNYGFVAVKMDGTSKSVFMINAASGNPVEVEYFPLGKDMIYLLITCDFNNRRDRATFYYSLDGVAWQEIGNSLHMSYTLPHFMGYRFALFNYGTKTTGGIVDFDYFRIDNSLDVTTTVGSVHPNSPAGFKLYENYPDPFNPSTTIDYTLPQESYVRLELFNVQGEKVTSLVDSYQYMGFHQVRWNGKDDLGRSASNGLYLCRFHAGTYNRSIRMLLLR
jgi:beta-xylosidase